jgi:multidrug resistance protein, MATE family
MCSGEHPSSSAEHDVCSGEHDVCSAEHSLCSAEHYKPRQLGVVRGAGPTMPDDPHTLAREVRRIAVPAILTSLLGTLVFVVDRVMLGHYSETSLAAMQIAGPVEWSLTSIFLAFEVGTIARVGRHIGARDRTRARRAALLSFGVALVAGVAVALLWPPIAPHLGRLFPRASPAAVDDARGYLSITLAASPIIFSSAAAIATLSAAGDTRTPLAVGVAANLFHVGLNRVLILGAFGIPALGMRGAGISTALTFCIEATLMVASLFRRTRPVSLRRSAGPSSASDYREEAHALGEVAIPAVAERVLYHAGYLGFIWVLARLGDEAMAANQSLISVESICFMSADGFGIAAAALVAQKLGAGEPQEAAKAARIAMRYAIVLLTTLGLVFLATRSLSLPLFSRDATVIALGSAAVPVLAVAQPFMATATVLAQSLRGAGRTRAVLVVSATGAFVVRIACTWLFAITCGFGLTGVWMGSTCDWIVRSVLLVGLARSRLAVDAGA